MAYTTTDFLASVRARGSIPTTTNSNNVNSTANLLILATEELHIKLFPLLLGVREEFYVTKTEYAITAGQAAYAIPYRAAGGSLRDIQIIQGSNIYSLSTIDSDYITTTVQGTVQGFYLENNNVILYPTPGATTGILRLRYFRRPGRLAATTSCAQVTAINTGTNQVTVASIPTAWATGTAIDFIQAIAPSVTLDVDYAISTVASTVITFAALPAGLAVNDWLAPAE